MHRRELLFWEPEPLDKTVSEKKILQFLLIVQGSVFGHWFGHTVRRRFRDGAGPRDPAGSLFLMILYIKLTSIGGILLVCLSLPISSISRATLSLCAERLSMSSSYCLLMVYFNQSQRWLPPVCHRHEIRMFVVLTRPSQDVDVLAVLDFQIPCFRPYTPVFMSEVSSPTTKAMDENKDVPNDSKDGNEGFEDPGRRARRRPEEPWFWLRIWS